MYNRIILGTFLLTKERRILSHFTGNTFESTQLLIVLREPSNRKSIGDLLRTPLKAFTNEAWLLMSFSVFYMAFVLFSIRETYDGKYNPTIKRRSVVTARATKSLYHGILSLTSGTASGQPTSPKLSERIVIAGFAIFGLFFLTAYQASFTVTLISNEIRGQFGSVDEVLAADLKICVVAASINSFLITFPQAENNYIRTNNNTQTLAFLDDGSCSAGVMTSTSFARAISLDLGHCENKTTTGSFILLAIPSAMPISGRFESFLSTVVQEGLGEGLFETLVTEFENDQMRPLCDNTNGAETDSEDSEMKRLSVMQMALAIMSTTLCTTIGLLMHLRAKYHFFLSKLGRRLKIKLMFAKVQRAFLAHTFLQNPTETFEIDPDEFLRKDLLSHTASVLLELLEDTSVSQTSLGEAMNSLPSTLALVDLVYLHKCSQKSRDIIFMETLSQLDLYKLLMKVAERKALNNNLETDWVNKALDDVHNPKGKLVSLVLSSPHAREVLQGMQRDLPENADDLPGISDSD